MRKGTGIKYWAEYPGIKQSAAKIRGANSAVLRKPFRKKKREKKRENLGIRHRSVTDLAGIA